MGTKTQLAALVAAVAALAGCGELGEVSGRIEKPQTVTRAQLDSYPSGSPERAVLGWWRALQFNSPELAARYYSPDLKLTTAKLEKLLRLGPDFLDLKSGLRVVDTVERGDTATVLAMRHRVLEHPNGRIDKVSIPMAVNLRREAGEWKLSDDRYFDRALKNAEAFIQEGTGK